jgi:hypothetical protein
VKSEDVADSRYCERKVKVSVSSAQAIDTRETFEIMQTFETLRPIEGHQSRIGVGGSASGFGCRVGWHIMMTSLQNVNDTD